MYKNKTELDGKKFPFGFLQKNIYKVAKTHNLMNDHKIIKTLISQRIVTAKHHVPYGKGSGFPYMLLKIEDGFCNLIISMSKYQYPIIVSNSLQFINNMILNT